MIKHSEKGQVFLLVTLVIGVVLVTTLVLIAGAQLYYQNSNYAVSSYKAVSLAEAGIDKAISALNKTGGNYSGDSEVFMGAGSFSTNITTKDAATKIIESVGYIPSKSDPKIKKTIRIQAARGVGAAFFYGIQVGEGGLALGNGNVVEGSVYSNGSITAGNSNLVKGDVWVAGGPQPVPDQETDCSGANCSDFIFGKTVNGDNRLDIAQSFKPNISGILNKVSIKIKKIGNPSDLTVRVVQDGGSKPDKNAVVTTGTLYSSLVTGTYSFIDITFNTSPAVVAGTTYWLMLDTSSDSSNYWSWQQDLAQSYNRGLPKWSPNWSAGNPSWNALSPDGDLSFKSYLGAAPNSVRAGSNKLTVNGEAHANTLQNLTIGKDAYYQTIIGSTVQGVSYPGSADPPPKVFPLSDANIQDWKNQVDKPELTFVGNITTCPTTLGPVKIVGSINLGSGCRVTVKSPIWITGDLVLNSNNDFTLHSDYKSTSGIIIVDGRVSINTNNHFLGTSEGSSLLMVLSNYDSRTNDISAISVNSNGNTGVYYAAKGIIEPGTGNTFKELTAWKIRLVNNSTIDYEQGLSSSLFTSGPSGAYSLVKGTYQVK
jgi:hypothetical protein